MQIGMRGLPGCAGTRRGEFGLRLRMGDGKNHRNLRRCGLEGASQSVSGTPGSLPCLETYKMSHNYLLIRNEYLRKAWLRPANELQAAIPAEVQGEQVRFAAFGEECSISRESVKLAGTEATGPEGLLIAMYASTVKAIPAQLQPLRSFKDLPNSMPYQAAFHANSERVLVPHVESIQIHQQKLIASFSGHANPNAGNGDFSFTLLPLPRIPLYYIFNLEDDEFPASVVCLFGANASEFLPLDGLADVAEYTAKRIIALVAGR